MTCSYSFRYSVLHRRDGEGLGNFFTKSSTSRRQMQHFILVKIKEEKEDDHSATFYIERRVKLYPVGGSGHQQRKNQTQGSRNCVPSLYALKYRDPHLNQIIPPRIIPLPFEESIAAAYLSGCSNPNWGRLPAPGTRVTVFLRE